MQEVGGLYAWRINNGRLSAPWSLVQETRFGVFVV